MRSTVSLQFNETGSSLSFAETFDLESNESGDSIVLL